MVDHATAKYLNDNVGGALAKGLAEMALAQPTDSIDFLARWLKTYADQEDAKAVREKEDKALEEERAKCMAKLAEKEEKRKKVMAEKKAKDDAYTQLLEKFNNPDTMFEESFWNDLVQVAKTYSGAEAVYLGILEEEGLDDVEGPCVCYQLATAGSEWMCEKTLAKETGVTWGALTPGMNPDEEEPFKAAYLWKVPIDESELPVVAEGEEPPPKPLEPYYPVSVQCVTDVKQLVYFDMTRLGGYLAIPLAFESFFTLEALAAATAFEDDKAKTLQARAEAQARVDEANEEGREPPEEDLALLATELEEKELVMPGKEIKRVLCMDTLGTNKAFDEAKFKDLLLLCKACGSCKARTESTQVDNQALKSIDAELRKDEEEAIAAAREAAAEELKEAMDQDDAAAEGEEAKDLVQKKYAFLRARHVALSETVQPMMLALKSWVVAAPEIMNLFAASLLLLSADKPPSQRFTKEKLYPKRKSVLKWDKLCSFITDDIFELMAGADLEVERKELTKEQKLSSIKSMAFPEGFTEEEARAKAPALEVLFILIQTACTYRTAFLDSKKSAYARMKEEDPDNFAEVPLEEQDDDYAE